MDNGDLVVITLPWRHVDFGGREDSPRFMSASRRVDCPEPVRRRFGHGDLAGGCRTAGRAPKHTAACSHACARSFPWCRRGSDTAREVSQASAPPQCCPLTRPYVSEAYEPFPPPILRVRRNRQSIANNGYYVQLVYSPRRVPSDPLPHRVTCPRSEAILARVFVCVELAPQVCWDCTASEVREFTESEA